MATTRILIVQKVETELEVEYESADDLKKQVREMELSAKKYLCSKKSAAIKHSKVYIAADNMSTLKELRGDDFRAVIKGE